MSSAATVLIGEFAPICNTERHEPSQVYHHTHFVGFRDDRYNAAVRAFGVPDFIHVGYDKRALREIGEGDTVVFADGPHDQEPRTRSFPDIYDGSEVGGRPRHLREGERP